MTRDADPRIRVGISSCLIGEEVRFDGGHKHDRFITGTLGEFFEFVTVCPEMEMRLVPLVVPLTLLKHHFTRHPQLWVASQIYLQPHPKELMLRNHV
ncbi:MAG: DUF1722 domain-containing protein [Planctomycetes bacterium]|nr:DUF1722 domain-containing protein [Planctomycetota bacterium]MBI3843273.1 DUF1722 domain-containing protein [Planctomycetota bacterium]